MQPVSPAECCRPSSTFPGSSWSPTSCQYYAIGNTAGFNVAAGFPSEKQHVRVLLAGCGDIRNLLASVAGLEDSASNSGSSSGMPQQPRQLQFVLSDGNISMLARNAVMLHMIVEQQVQPETVLSVWANHALSEREHKLLMESCAALATGPWPAWLSAADGIDTAAVGPAAAGVRSSEGSSREGAKGAAEPPGATGSSSSVTTSCSSGCADSNRGGGDAGEASVRAACAAWAACTVSLQHLLQERDTLAGTAGLQQAAVDFSLSAVAAAVTGSNGSSGSTSSRNLSKSLIKEISEYIRTGSLSVQGRSDKQPRNQPNVTLLKAPELQYGLYFSSSIFRAVRLHNSVANAASSAAGPGSGAVLMLLATVGPQIEAVAAAARQAAGGAAAG